MNPVSVKGRLGSVRAFLRFLMEDGVVRHEVLAKPISVKIPDLLPRAIPPEDVRELLSVIHQTRDRAMELLLRIGELLTLRMDDIDLPIRR